VGDIPVGDIKGIDERGDLMALDQRVRELAAGANFAAFTTLTPSGWPMTHVVWVDCDEEHVLINTEVHRAKFKNIQRDPRVAVTIIDGDDPYRFAEVRGRVVNTVGGERARRHIDELSQKYHGHPYSNRIQSERVILEIKPERQRS
jgi:PPOX class probable F420-dependent enzyme